MRERGIFVAQEDDFVLTMEAPTVESSATKASKAVDCSAAEARSSMETASNRGASTKCSDRMTVEAVSYRDRPRSVKCVNVSMRKRKRRSPRHER